MLDRCCRGQARFCIRFLLTAGLWLLASVEAEPPAWWNSQNVLRTDATADDFAVLNQGQLKNLATKAAAEMNAHLSGGAGAPINNLVQQWNGNQDGADDFAVASLGHLKAVSKLFYDRLGLAYPWASSANSADDYAAANLGQAKNLFSFAIVATDNRGSSQAWRDWLKAYGLPANTNPDADADGDGVSNWNEFLAGRDPIRREASAELLAWLSGWEGSAGSPSLEGFEPDKVGLRVYTRLR